ncbi:hypothetical protein L218DRAFT_176340 [Marasmius fiardii PR-910]|nr:hypothetical protein L218DRAFT_176340 [Marasmius fiardii PR-910]
MLSFVSQNRAIRVRADRVFQKFKGWKIFGLGGEAVTRSPVFEGWFCATFLPPSPATFHLLLRDSTSSIKLFPTSSQMAQQHNELAVYWLNDWPPTYEPLVYEFPSSSFHFPQTPLAEVTQGGANLSLMPPTVYEGATTWGGNSTGSLESLGVPNHLSSSLPHNFEPATFGGTYMYPHIDESHSAPQQPSPAQSSWGEIYGWQEPADPFFPLDTSNRSTYPTPRVHRAHHYPTANTSVGIAAQAPHASSPSHSSTSPPPSPSDSPFDSPPASQPTSTVSTNSDDQTDGPVTFKSNRCFCGHEILSTGESLLSSMTTHLRVAHGVLQSRRDLYTCPWEGCHRTYVKSKGGGDPRKSLKRHISHVHLDIKYVCKNSPSCRASFTRLDTRTSHHKTCQA